MYLRKMARRRNEVEAENNRYFHCVLVLQRSRAVVARQVHTLEASGSNPLSATEAQEPSCAVRPSANNWMLGDK